MKVILSTLNSKFIHSSLALAYLEAACKNREWELQVMEFTINEKLDKVMSDIFQSQPDVLSFSCYIWNIEPILSLCRDFKQVSPDCLIVLGGPEVSYDAGQVLSDNPAVDYIVRGEGEVTLPELLEHIFRGLPVDEVKGVSYRKDDIIYENTARDLIADLGVIASPYNKDFTDYRDKIVYFESSRGCPFNCSYCLSSTIKGVRYFPLDRVKAELKHLLKFPLREIKFVDRTFNSDENRAREIMQFIIEQKSDTKVHMEICAEFISPDFMDFLKNVPPNIFNFEIGVQSTCPQTLHAVRRYNDWQRLQKNIMQLKSFRNIHLHLDLIAGLPLESYERFQQSFNDVYDLDPDMLQLGFLKLLKGSDIYLNRHRYDYRFQSRAPYQVLSNSQMSYQEMIRLSQVEELLNRYFNTSIAPKTLDYAVKTLSNGNAFRFFEQFSQYWVDHRLFGLGHRREREYDILLEFIKNIRPENELECNELIKYDYLTNNLPHHFPSAVKRINPQNTKEVLNSWVKNSDATAQLPEAVKGSWRQMVKYLHLEYFAVNPFTLEKTANLALLFVYHPTEKKAVNVIAIDDAS